MNPSTDGEFRTAKTTSSTAFKLVSVLFKREDNEIKWDVVDGHDDVLVIIFNKTRNMLVCTKQFRAGLYISSIPDCDKTVDRSIDTTKYPLSNGFAIEFCTGTAVKNKSYEETAISSLHEQCGYKVDISNLKKIVTTKHGGTKLTFFYTEVTDSMKISCKDVKAIEYTISEIKNITTQPEFLNGSFSFIFGLMWFLFNKSLLKC